MNPAMLVSRGHGQGVQVNGRLFPALEQILLKLLREKNEQQSFFQLYIFHSLYNHMLTNMIILKINEIVELT